MTLIRVAHSPDSDDAFMFYALARELIDTGGLRFEHVLSDIESLNREAFEGTYEVTAVSIRGLRWATATVRCWWRANRWARNSSQG
jgi:predicted solute-binding protein